MKVFNGRRRRVGEEPRRVYRAFLRAGKGGVKEKKEKKRKKKKTLQHSTPHSHSKRKKKMRVHDRLSV
jgi:hypothetical protein